MEIFSGFNVARQRPLGAIQSFMSYGARTVIESVFGQPLDKNELWRRSVQMPLVDARQGAEAIQKAADTGDEELDEIGKAKLGKAIVAANEVADDTPVHAAVAAEVKAIAIAVPLEGEDLANNRCISDDIALRAAKILGGSEEM